MPPIETRRAQQMRDLLREKRGENARTVAEAFRTRFPDVGAANENRTDDGPAFDATDEASARLLKALNRAAAVQARWKTMSFANE